MSDPSSHKTPGGEHDPSSDGLAFVEDAFACLELIDPGLRWKRHEWEPPADRTDMYLNYWRMCWHNHEIRLWNWEWSDAEPRSVDPETDPWWWEDFDPVISLCVLAQDEHGRLVNPWAKMLAVLAARALLQWARDAVPDIKERVEKARALRHGRAPLLKAGLADEVARRDAEIARLCDELARLGYQLPGDRGGRPTKPEAITRTHRLMGVAGFEPAETMELLENLEWCFLSEMRTAGLAPPDDPKRESKRRMIRAQRQPAELGQRPRSSLDEKNTWMQKLRGDTALHARMIADIGSGWFYLPYHSVFLERCEKKRVELEDSDTLYEMERDRRLFGV